MKKNGNANIANLRHQIADFDSIRFIAPTMLPRFRLELPPYTQSLAKGKTFWRNITQMFLPLRPILAVWSRSNVHLANKSPESIHASFS